ncbi:MAG: type II toxin-antitoxin system VapC family toxin [Actinoallomurus sp.]
MLPTVRAVLDTGVLINAESRSKVSWSIQRKARGSRTLIVTTPVLTQVWRSGPRQAALCRFLKGCEVDSPSEAVAKRAGELLARTGTSDAVDAIVVATAIEMDAATIFTSDPDDLEALLEVSESAVRPLIQKV